MSTITKPLPHFEDFAEKVLDWMKLSASTTAEGKEENKEAVRAWCTLKLPGLTESDLNTYFDRKALGDKFKEEQEKVSNTGIRC